MLLETKAKATSRAVVRLCYRTISSRPWLEFFVGLYSLTFIIRHIIHLTRSSPLMCYVLALYSFFFVVFLSWQQNIQLGGAFPCLKMEPDTDPDHH